MQIAGQDAELPEIRRRARFFGIFVMLVFLAIAGRLFYLQVIEGDTFYRLTSDNIIRTDPLPAVRGQIRDRKNRVLATVRPSYNLYVSPRQLTSDGFAKLRGALGMSAEQAVEVWERIRGERADGTTPAARNERPVLLAEDISREAMAAIETGLDVPGVKIVSVVRREYPYGDVASHVLGYMNEISAEELRAKKDEGYHAGDLVGRTGVERQWEGYLRGRDGFDKIVVDRRGLPRPNIRELIDGPVKQPAVAGNNVFLTIDVDVQRMAERSLRAYSAAAAVVMDVETGRLLAMVSKPGFDPNEMSGHLSPEAQQRLPGGPFPSAARQGAQRDVLPRARRSRRCRRWRRWRIG